MLACGCTGAVPDSGNAGTVRARSESARSACELRRIQVGRGSDVGFVGLLGIDILISIAVVKLWLRRRLVTAFQPA